ncbi:MAG: hypothetical protein AUH78_20530 [Gemmatimonadetes bacterium 13_1_40CM_4_69_8]|nr:MAG: hypothetical protein AUH78_20530 [Gemmatimonadetes bacterium 13_1_40CM_4_69_8]
MIGTAGLVCAVAAAVQAQTATLDRMRTLAEAGGPQLVEAVRAQPDDARQALRQLLDRTAASDSGTAAASLSAADRLAHAYAEAWGDSFPLRQVARFASWSPEERVAKVAADSIRRAGNAALGRSGADSAILSWRESARRSAALADTAGIAAAVGNIGAGFYRAGKLDSAESYLEQSRRLAELVGDRRTALNALGTLGSVSKDRGELRRAADRYTRAFAIRQQIGDFRGMAADRNNLGLIAQLLGDLDEARRAYEDALGLSRAHGLDEPAAVSLVNLGDVASLQADYAEAIARFGEALAIYRHLGSRVDAAFVLHSLGLLELQRGDYPNAIARLSDAAAVYQQTGPVPEAVSVRKDLAFAYAATGNLQRALIELRGAGRLSGRGPLAPGLGATLALARADLAAQFNNFAQADREYAQAEALYRRAGENAGLAEAQQGRGFLRLVWEDYQRAQVVLESAARTQAASGDGRSAALTRVLVGYAQQHRGDTAAARRTLVVAVDTLRSLRDPVGEAAGLAALGDLDLQEGRAFAAESLFSQGLMRLGPRLAPSISWRLHAGLGAALKTRGAFPDAARELEAAIAQIEQVSGTLPLVERRAAYLEDKWDVYAQLALVDQAGGHTGAAFEVSERMRARQTLDLLGRGRVARGAAGSEPITAQEQDLRRRIAELTERLDVGDTSAPGLRGPDVAARPSGATREALGKAQERYAELLLEMRETQPEYASLVSGNIVSWRDVASRLASDEALLEYLVTDSASVVFVITPDTVTTLDLNVGRQGLATLVDFVRGTMTRPSPDGTRAREAWRAPMRRLYGYLIAPVEAAGLLQRTRRLIIAPHAELHYLPFAALIDRGGHDRVLIERYDLIYVPSASVWARLGERRGTPMGEDVLALAPRSAALPGSRAEVEAIRSLYGTRATVLAGAAASEQAFRTAASRYGVLHLATSGVLNKHNPLFSFVKLAPGGTQDGRLEVHEVFGLALNARLVVLSACQTALGAGAQADVPAGDEWVGLVRAFFHAGASNVLATLWPVEDRTTAELIGRFYRQLQAGHSEAEALAQAQRLTLRDPRTAHPFYWAGFTLSGGWHG